MSPEIKISIDYIQHYLNILYQEKLTLNALRKRSSPTNGEATLTQVTGLGMSSRAAARKANNELNAAPRLYPYTRFGTMMRIIRYILYIISIISMR